MVITTRTIEFPIAAIIDSDMTIKAFKTITIKIGVTKPNMNGYFSIFTQIGDEIPIERKTNIDNERIIKNMENKYIRL